MNVLNIRNPKTGAWDGVPAIRGPKGEPGSDASVTAANIQSALGYTPVNPGKLSMGIHTDGLCYLFVDGQPVGTGIEIAPGGDVVGYVDSENNIVVKGSLADGSYSVKYEMEDGSTVDIGELVLDTNVYYSVTNHLTNCASSNSAAQAIKDGSYAAVISPNSGYELSSVTVTMGGTDITPSAVSGGNINIANVTGDIVITAAAEESTVSPSYTNLATTFKEGYRYNSSGALVEQEGICACEDYIPYTVGTVVRVKGFGNLNVYNAVFYGANKTTVNTVSKVSARSTYNYDETTGIVTITSTKETDHYIRIVGVLTGAASDVIITVNEPIV